MTLDSKRPLGLEQVALHEPDAVMLGRIVAALSDEELAARGALLLEPMYLQDAFITVAKKAGKQVPAER